MLRITINHKNLIPDETWLYFRKVRAIIENDLDQIAISEEGGKYIFPGGKCEPREDELAAIVREIKEETGISIPFSKFQKVLELETMYDDFYNYRTQSYIPRHTITSYFYATTEEKIDEAKMSLTEAEKKEKFTIHFEDRDSLIECLMEAHTEVETAKFFDEENQIIVKHFLKQKKF